MSPCNICTQRHKTSVFEMSLMLAPNKSIVGTDSTGACCTHDEPSTGAIAQTHNKSRASIHTLETEIDQPPPRDLNPPATLQELENKFAPWKVDVADQHGKIRVLINNDGKGFGVVTGACTVQQGQTFLLPGGGGFRSDEEAAKAKEEGYFTMIASLQKDSEEVIYKNGKTRTKYTIYGLKAQLALDGYPEAALNCHILEEQPSSAGVQRFGVKNLVQKNGSTCPGSGRPKSCR